MMKTANFIDEVTRLRGLELKVEVDDETIVVTNRFTDYVLVIERDELCTFDTRFNGFRNLNDDDKIELYMLCNRYVMSDEIAKNKIDYDTMLKGHKARSDFAKLLDNFPFNPWLNDFEVAMVEKALNIQLYPWQKEFLKGSNCVNINKGSGKTYLFTLAYTLKLISLPMLTNYDIDVHRCVSIPVYSGTEKSIGEMFIDFYEKLAVYPFELNTTLKLVKEWSV